MSKPRIVRWLAAVWLVSFAAAASASFHLWRVNEIYSNADGTIQFIELHEIGGANGENFVGGHRITVMQGNQTHTVTLRDDLPGSATENGYFLVGTLAFANLGVVAPDYIIPSGFLFTDGGVVQWGASGSGIYGTAPVDSVAYSALPTDGTTSIARDGTPRTNSPRNFAGATGTIGVVDTASPQTGWWWNSAESGRGYFIERQGNNLFFAAYLYANDGRAMWTISAGPMSSSTSYSGSLLALSGGQTLTGPYQAPALGLSLGNLTLNFTDATHGTMTWPGGTMAIQRFDYGGFPLPATTGAPQSGWWWNAAENGRGFSLETQGSTLFIAGYMYDATGNPVWYLSVGTVDAAGGYQGTWQQFANGQTLSGPYVAPTLVDGNVGSLTLQFTDKQNGTLTLPDMRVVPITRFRF